MSMRGDLEDVLWAAVVAEGWAGSLDRGRGRGPGAGDRRRPPGSRG